MPALRPALFAASLLMLIPMAAQAQTAPTPTQEWQAYGDALERGARQATLWRYGWSGVYAASLAYNAFEASEADESDDRFDAKVGAVKSALALGGTWFDPLPHPQAYREFTRL
ncbi:MAG: hypothetical protein UMU75_12020, partial [Halomonas sp.]|nr:hypothetical protein [Halomonas sp.]